VQPYEVIRTHSRHADFIRLQHALDAELAGRYGDEQLHFSQYNSVEDAKVLLVYVNHTPVACGSFRTHHQGVAEIKRMYVQPIHRHRGLGKLLLAELEPWARSCGFEALILETGIKQPEAQRSYIRFGFRQIPNYPPYDRSSYSICFRKDLQ
jgi:putative acetyltransferase